MLLTSIALALVAASPAEAPLQVRVLARYHPRSVELESAELACDGERLGLPRVRAHLAAGELALTSGRRCEVIEAREATVAVEGVRRRYRGRVRARARSGEIALVNEVDAEGYLRGVLGGEQLPGAPEAMRAQAVVSRTFALASRGRHAAEGHDLCDLAHCQVYGGREAETPEAVLAAAATAGIVLESGGALRPTYFHSSCGGATSAPGDVFGEPGPLAGADDRHGGRALCAASPDAAWSWRAGRAAFARAIGAGNEGPALEVLRRDRAGRILEVRCFGARLSGAELQSRVGRAFGWTALKSLNATVEEAGGEVRVRGSGRGHGVGMCQWGARELARRGEDWRAILRHYFPAARPVSR